MPRAIAAFRAQGLDLEPYPVDYRTEGDASDLTWLRRAPLAAIGLADVAAHEWLGLIWYRLTSRTREFFPGPSATPSSCGGRR
jgi:uncharacterized SAM-binding protein YcdF (DUF218 family)